MWMYQLPGSMDSFGLGMIGAIIHVQYTESRESAKSYQMALGVLLCIAPLIFLSVGVWMAEEFATYWTKSPHTVFMDPYFLCRRTNCNSECCEKSGGAQHIAWQSC